MTPEERFVADVLRWVPRGVRRAQIEMDLTAHLAERMEQGQPAEEAIRQFGDPAVLAASYLEGVPLVSAPLFERAAAKIVDTLAIVATVYVVASPLWRWLAPPEAPLVPALHEWKDAPALVLWVITFVWLLPAYFAVAEYLTDQTLGKVICRLRVVRESGARITFGQSLLRQLPLAASILVLDALFALFTEKRQRAFELISKTRVVSVAETAVPAATPELS